MLLTNAFWVRRRAIMATNITVEQARKHKLLFSSSNTELVFTNKQEPNLGAIWMSGRRHELSNDAKLFDLFYT